MAPLTSRYVVVLLICLCTGTEFFLIASEQGWFGLRSWRRFAYDYGAFWPGLLGSWPSNYAAQPWVMFLTYGVLHSGINHLVANMVILWFLSGLVLNRVGARGFLLVYLGAQIGGGLAFAGLAAVFPPMVGASGALFGLAGAILAWNYVDRFTYDKGLWPVVSIAFLLVILNVVQWWAMQGQLAWETHLGGFVAGWIMALLVDPRARDADPD